MAEEEKENKEERKNEANNQEPKIIHLKPREVRESEDMKADRERLKRLLESERQ